MEEYKNSLKILGRAIMILNDFRIYRKIRLGFLSKTPPDATPVWCEVTSFPTGMWNFIPCSTYP